MAEHHDDHGHGHSHGEEGTYFDNSTVALGTIYTIVVICVVASILIWG